MTMPSTSPRPITLVSPVRIAVPASRQASRIDARIRSRSGRGNPSSMITLQVSPSTSVAPIIARSLTVPETASRPMSPPGKNGGWMTCESVVRTSQRSPMRHGRAVVHRGEADEAGGLGRPGGERVQEHLLDEPAHRAAAGAVLHQDAIVGTGRHAVASPAIPDRARRRTGARSGTCPRCSPCTRRPATRARTRCRRARSRGATRCRP